jgi:hypothetical protein
MGITDSKGDIMNQTFTMGSLQLIQDKDGYGVAEKTEKGYEVVATFKYPLDALKYFTEYSLIMAEIALTQEKK